MYTCSIKTLKSTCNCLQSWHINLVKPSLSCRANVANAAQSMLCTMVIATIPNWAGGGVCGLQMANGLPKKKILT